jgi:hypothetical protein
VDQPEAPLRRIVRGFPGTGRTAQRLSPDGQRFLVIKEGAAAQQPSSELMVVEHWFEELKRHCVGWAR